MCPFEDSPAIPGAREEMWRRIQFERLAFSESAAHELALSEATLDQARSMLENGATHAQVVAILA